MHTHSAEESDPVATLHVCVDGIHLSLTYPHFWVVWNRGKTQGWAFATFTKKLSEQNRFYGRVVMSSSKVLLWSLWMYWPCQ